MSAHGPRPAALLAALLAATGAADTAAPAAGAERQTRHALVIGIGEYGDPEIPRLKGAVHDIASARRMAAAMAIAPANITVLRDHEATADRIRAEITALNGRVREGDRVFVYYSGHGTRWYDERVTADGCTEGLVASDGRVLSNAELGQRLAPLAQRADKMLVFYDACFSGGVAGAPLRTRSFTLHGEQITPKFTRAGASEACARPSSCGCRPHDELSPSSVARCRCRPRHRRRRPDCGMCTLGGRTCRRCSPGRASSASRRGWPRAPCPARWRRRWPLPASRATACRRPVRARWSNWRPAAPPRPPPPPRSTGRGLGVGQHAGAPGRAPHRRCRAAACRGHPPRDQRPGLRAAAAGPARASAGVLRVVEIVRQAHSSASWLAGSGVPARTGRDDLARTLVPAVAPALAPELGMPT